MWPVGAAVLEMLAGSLGAWSQHVKSQQKLSDQGGEQSVMCVYLECSLAARLGCSKNHISM